MALGDARDLSQAEQALSMLTPADPDAPVPLVAGVDKPALFAFKKKCKNQIGDSWSTECDDRFQVAFAAYPSEVPTASSPSLFGILFGLCAMDRVE